MAEILEKSPEERQQEREASSSLERILPGRIVETEHGVFYLAEQTSRDTGLHHIDWRFADLFERELEEDSGPLQDLLSGKPEDLLFLDIETTGFSNCPLFLIGLAFYSENGMRVELLFARDYSEEIGALTYLVDRLEAFRSLVSFNGRSFDVPFIRNRLAYHRHPGHVDLPHFDLLHPSRRQWKDSLPNCKLQTLETRICGRPRTGDIPSALIPDAYHEFVRTGQTYLLKEIIHHNVLDLLTMAELLVALVDAQQA